MQLAPVLHIVALNASMQVIWSQTGMPVLRAGMTTSSLDDVTDMWCTERSKGNRISHKHSSHSSDDILLPWLTTTANRVRTAQFRTSERMSVLLMPCKQYGQNFADESLQTRRSFRKQIAKQQTKCMRQSAAHEQGCALQVHSICRAGRATAGLIDK